MSFLLVNNFEMQRRRPRRKKRAEPTEKYFIGHGKGATYTIFKGDPKDMIVAKYPQYFFIDGPYESYEGAFKDATALGYRIMP